MKSIISLLCLALLSPSAFAQKAHWTILESSENLTVQEEFWAAHPNDLSPQQKEKLMKRARSKGVQVDDIFVMQKERLPSKVKTPHAKCETSAAYCASLDSLRALNDEVLACPQIEVQGILSSSDPMPGDSIYGISAMCVKENVRKVLDQAKIILKDDFNLDWVAGALALSEQCYLNRYNNLYCDAVDFSRRNGFVDDLLEQLKKGPKPIRFEVTTSVSVHWQGEDVKLSDATEPASTWSEQVIHGEYLVMKLNPRQIEYSDKEVLLQRGAKVGVMYPSSATHDDYAFALGEMRNECARLKGNLIVDAKESPGAPHVGVLRKGLDRYVYYLGSCKIPN